MEASAVEATERKAHKPESEPVTVLYIMGLWRSGSTILDIILGNHPALESVGELRNLPREGWLGAEVCACGQPARDCPYWTRVRSSWNARVGGDKAERLIELQDHFERLRSMPALLGGRLVGASADFEEYSFLLGALYRAIAEVSGKSIIVDSTKYPARALALQRMPGIRLLLIHLVRDGRAVIWSYHRKPNVDFEGNVIQIPADEVAKWTTRQWLWVNALSALPSMIAPDRAIRILYEDLVTRPEAELARVSRMVGVDLQPIATRMLEGSELNVGHMIAGNRVRHEGVVRLRPDLDWREKLSAADRRAFWRRAGWLARRYGYER